VIATVGPGWARATLGELTRTTRPICYGVLKPGPNVAGGIPLVRVTDISENRFCDKHLICISHRLDEEFRRSRLRGGEILVSIQGTVGRVAICPPEYAGANISRTIAVIEPDDRADRRYSYWYLRHLGEAGAFKTVGSTRASLNIAALRNVEIPLPPLPVQRRIVAILDQADALREKRRLTIAQLDALSWSVFFDMFGDPGTNEKKWDESTLGKLCMVKGGKRLPKGEDYSPIPTPFRYVRVTDLQEGWVDEAALLYLRPEIQSRISRYIVNTGDIIVSIAGSIGLVAPVPPSVDGANLTENAAKLVPKTRGAYDPIFLSVLLQTAFLQSQIRSHVGQVTIGKLALFRIEKLRVFLPPVDLQKEFAKRSAVIQSALSVHRNSLANLDTLFASLEHRVFQGEL